VNNGWAAGISAPNAEFREVTDRLKIQVLDLVDDIASLHFAHAKTQQRRQVLEQLSQLGSAFFLQLSHSELDTMTDQCHKVLELISQAKEQQDEAADTLDLSSIFKDQDQ